MEGGRTGRRGGEGEAEHTVSTAKGGGARRASKGPSPPRRWHLPTGTHSCGTWRFGRTAPSRRTCGPAWFHTGQAPQHKGVQRDDVHLHRSVGMGKLSSPHSHTHTHIQKHMHPFPQPSPSLATGWCAACPSHRALEALHHVPNVGKEGQGSLAVQLTMTTEAQQHEHRAAAKEKEGDKTRGGRAQHSRGKQGVRSGPVHGVERM